MIKYKRTTIGTGENAVTSEVEILDKDIKVGDKIHVCYHDETPVRPCKIVDG
jgi:hypothetical protein